MSLWEYKVLTSGPHGFASPALLETHLNTLGKDEWEIVYFQTLPNNALAFHGLARRSTVRDWTPPEPVALPNASKPAAYESPLAVATKPSSAPAPAVTDEKAEVARDEAEAPLQKTEKTAIRTVRDTERDLDPEAEDEEEDDWDNWEEDQDDLPTFFEAIKPHLRRNQKGPGMSVAVDYLAKRWDQREADLVGALKECGFNLPESEDAEPDYFEFEGDLYWVNRNNRGQLFINTREKPRPTFRIATAKKVSADDPAMSELNAERAAEKAEIEKRRAERIEREERQAAAAAEKAKARAAAQAATPAPAPASPGSAAEEGGSAPSGPLPSGSELLEKIRPLMRRNRRGPGYSGSISFLARALKHNEADLVSAFAALGLNAPANAGDKPVFVEIDDGVYWLNKDNRGGVWINGREKREGAPKAETENGESSRSSDSAPLEGAPVGDAASSELVPAKEEQPALPLDAAPAATPAPATSETPSSSEGKGSSVFAAVRLLMKPNKRGSGVSGEVGFLARSLEKGEDEFITALTQAGVVVPPDSETKPVFVEHEGEIFWLNKNSNDGSLWLNAKAAKSAKKSGGGGRSRAPRKPKAEPPSE